MPLTLNSVPARLVDCQVRGRQIFETNSPSKAFRWKQNIVIRPAICSTKTSPSIRRPASEETDTRIHYRQSNLTYLRNWIRPLADTVLSMGFHTQTYNGYIDPTLAIGLLRQRALIPGTRTNTDVCFNIEANASPADSSSVAHEGIKLEHCIGFSTDFVWKQDGDVADNCAVGPPRICTKPVKTAGLYNETDVIDIVEGTQLRIPDTRTAGGEVFLSDPYSMKHAFPISGLGGSMLPNVRAIQSVMEEPSQAALEILVDAFLSRFFERGFFFLESLQFRQSTLLSLPFGHPDRPSPGLLGVVYLWGSYISSKRRQPVHDYTEEDLISLAVHNLAQDTVHVTGPMTHLPQFFFHTVQAEVLLSLWYLNSGQVLPGRYHCAAAASLAAALDTPGSVEFMGPNPWMLTPTDVAEVNQRVNALWAVLALDKLWAVASGLPSSVLFETSALIRCPMFNIAQENPSMLPLMSTIDTHFGHPPFALLAKAALFLERSITVGNGPAGGYSPAQFNDSPHWSELQNPPEVFILALQVDNFRTSLPSLARNNGFSVNHTLLVTHCLTNVAIIRLNAPHILNYPDSIGRAFLAAEQVVSDILLVEHWLGTR
ncbi:hypothetical protein B0H13DRAFT_2565127 [Mycena leptocephala]|nr:hypothetical protein B0H13DRAFT_2565127 [Mycena leptocephala]